MFTVSEPYRPRPIRFLRVAEDRGWRLKVYSIIYGADPLDETAYQHGLRLAFDDALPQPAVTEHRPGVGFVICHQGRGIHYLVVCWWDNENELFTRVFLRSFDETATWEPAEGRGAPCVWDQQIIAFERDAYVQTVLSESVHLDCNAYVAQRYELAPSI